MIIIIIMNEMSLQPFTLFSFNISACGFVLVGLKIIIIITMTMFMVLSS